MRRRRPGAAAGTASRGHPAIGERLTLEDYVAARHAVVRPDGRGSEVDQMLAPAHAPRRVVVEISHFMSLLPILEASDLVAMVPRDVGQLCVRYGRLRMMAPPFQPPSIPVHQFWHERLHRDPGHAWPRNLISGIGTGE